jgi:hypothetical protein
MSPLFVENILLPRAFIAAAEASRCHFKKRNVPGGDAPTHMYFINRVLSQRVTRNFPKKGDAYKSL